MHPRGSSIRSFRTCQRYTRGPGHVHPCRHERPDFYECGTVGPTVNFQLFLRWALAHSRPSASLSRTNLAEKNCAWVWITRKRQQARAERQISTSIKTYNPTSGWKSGVPMTCLAVVGFQAPCLPLMVAATCRDSRQQQISPDSLFLLGVRVSSLRSLRHRLIVWLPYRQCDRTPWCYFSKLIISRNKSLHCHNPKSTLVSWNISTRSFQRW